MLVDNFRRNIVDLKSKKSYTTNFERINFPFFLRGTGPKINNLKRILFRGDHHNILRLEIPMYDPIHMNISHCGQKLLHISFSNVLVHTFTFDNPIK